MMNEWGGREVLHIVEIHFKKRFCKDFKDCDGPNYRILVNGDQITELKSNIDQTKQQYTYLRAKGSVKPLQLWLIKPNIQEALFSM